MAEQPFQGVTDTATVIKPQTPVPTGPADEASRWRPVPVAWRPPRPLDALRALSGVLAASLGLGYVPDGMASTAGFAVICLHGVVEFVSGCVRRTG
ncbi:hypothetical protein [Streptomyces sp. TLI_105]|uniref:hypothetical protein n=1 Tax=Streptomyces sp. TLI_105 TaxID=1881019 RepID=UPI00115F94AB|nr:hypothetical protein [Streptomyces sp. TLI_105]